MKRAPLQSYEVVKSFPYRGVRLKAGDRVEVEPEHVSLLAALGNIKDPSAPKGAYKRRDLRPEG